MFFNYFSILHLNIFHVQTKYEVFDTLSPVMKVLDVSLVSATPSGLIDTYRHVLGSLNTDVWNYYLLGSTHCVLSLEFDFFYTKSHPWMGKLLSRDAVDAAVSQ